MKKLLIFLVILLFCYLAISGLAKGQNNNQDNTIILIADKSVSGDQINSVKLLAQKQGTDLIIIQNKSTDPEYLIEGDLTAKLLNNKEKVKDAKIIILWTSGNLGFNVLSKFAQTENLKEFSFKNKAIFGIIEKNFSAYTRFAQSTFDLLKPEYILFTKEIALPVLFEEKMPANILEEIRKSGISHNLIGVYSSRAQKIGLTNFLSYTVNYLVNRGVSSENIFLILMLPVIAATVTFARQFLGIKTFGIYTPTIITLSFVATGLKYGLLLFVIILVSATLMRFILKKINLLYLPRMAILLTIVAFAILGMFALGAIFGRAGLISLSIFPILILIILSEKFIAMQIEKGGRQTIGLTFETLLVSVGGYYLVTWPWFKTLILGYPEIVLLTLVVDLLLGKWIGLRLSEHLRFRELRKFIKEKG